MGTLGAAERGMERGEEVGRRKEGGGGWEERGEQEIIGKEGKMQHSTIHFMLPEMVCMK